VVKRLTQSATALKLRDLCRAAWDATGGRNVAHLLPNFIADRRQFFDGTAKRVIED
jgi:hypothetical protein